MGEREEDMQHIHLSRHARERGDMQHILPSHHAREEETCSTYCPPTMLERETCSTYSYPGMVGGGGT